LLHIRIKSVLPSFRKNPPVGCKKYKKYFTIWFNKYCIMAN